MKLRDLHNIFANQNVYLQSAQPSSGVRTSKPCFGLLQYADKQLQDAEVLAIIHGSLLHRKGSHANVYTILIDR